MLIYDFSLGERHKDYKAQLREHCKKYKIIDKVSFPVKEYITTIADAPKEFENIVMSKEELESLRCKAMSIGAVVISLLIITAMVLIGIATGAIIL